MATQGYTISLSQKNQTANSSTVVVHCKRKSGCTWQRTNSAAIIVDNIIIGSWATPYVFDKYSTNWVWSSGEDMRRYQRWQRTSGTTAQGLNRWKALEWKKGSSADYEYASMYFNQDDAGRSPSNTTWQGNLDDLLTEASASKNGLTIDKQRKPFYRMSDDTIDFEYVVKIDKGNKRVGTKRITCKIKDLRDNPYWTEQVAYIDLSTSNTADPSGNAPELSIDNDSRKIDISISTVNPENYYTFTIRYKIDNGDWIDIDKTQTTSWKGSIDITDNMINNTVYVEYIATGKDGNTYIKSGDKQSNIFVEQNRKSIFPKVGDDIETTYTLWYKDEDGNIQEVYSEYAKRNTSILKING